MPRHELSLWFSNEGTRNEVRMRVIDAFSAEAPGTGAGDEASKYTYYVETLNDGNRVFLSRPAFLHNGFDFLVSVENMNYSPEGKRKRSAPTHDDIHIDLEAKKLESPEKYAQLFGLIKKVFECHDVSEEEMKSVSFTEGLPVDHILKVVKWLFIEQDIRYWNNSGRNMTWGIVPEP